MTRSCIVTFRIIAQTSISSCLLSLRVINVSRMTETPRTPVSRAAVNLQELRLGKLPQRNGASTPFKALDARNTFSPNNLPLRLFVIHAFKVTFLWDVALRGRGTLRQKVPIRLPAKCKNQNKKELTGSR
ncbi:hypothetical protein CEXT_170391 [Caerostris extrusa]|uniref:Secreted protein n=1 Tax=Caerostris extrusa TaxID=172846 RepID=A0AAV4M713_CAEEX|nr:hypothetical protein CEXT_170391 [Caerostris extrusa]